MTKHVLSRTVDGFKGSASALKRLKKNPLAVEKRDNYLSILEMTGGDMEAALRRSGLSFIRSKQWRTHDPEFYARERACCDPVKLVQGLYISALHGNYGNRTKARRDTEVSKAEVDEWMKDPAFERMEQEVYESFVDEANEQNTRLIVGAETKIRDTQHLRWVLPKIDKRWEEQPKVLEHRYGGSVTVKDTRDRIRELMRPEDIVDGEISDE